MRAVALEVDVSKADQVEGMVAKTLSEFGLPWEAKVVSAHRTPELLYDYASSAAGHGLQCLIAGAGGAARCARHRALHALDGGAAEIRAPIGNRSHAAAQSTHRAPRIFTTRACDSLLQRSDRRTGR